MLKTLDGDRLLLGLVWNASACGRDAPDSLVLPSTAGFTAECSGVLGARFSPSSIAGKLPAGPFLSGRACRCGGRLFIQRRS